MWYQKGEIQMKKEDIKNFIGDAINKEKFDEIPEFLWLWDDFLYLLIKEKISPKNFRKLWECIKNRSLNEAHYGALLDNGITFDMMRVMEINDSLFEAALKRKRFHNVLLLYRHILTNNQIVKLFTEGDFHSKKSLEILYNRIVRFELTPQQLVKVMCKCENVKTVEQLVHKVPDYYWKIEKFVKLIAMGGPVYSDEDYFWIISKIMEANTRLSELTNIVDLFGYSAFRYFFEGDDLKEFHVLELYIDTMKADRDMSGDQWELLVRACGSARLALQELKKRYTPTAIQLSELEKYGLIHSD